MASTYDRDFLAAEDEYGLPEGYLGRLSTIESNGDPLARNPNSSAKGLFQFTDETANEFGVNPFDPQSSISGAARLASRNRDELRRRLGRDPTDSELYLAHQQGAAGAAALLNNSNRFAVDVLEDIYGNRDVAEKAILNNGGSLELSAADFASSITGKYSSTSYTPNVPKGTGAMEGLETYKSLSADADAAAQQTFVQAMGIGEGFGDVFSAEDMEAFVAGQNELSLFSDDEITQAATRLGLDAEAARGLVAPANLSEIFGRGFDTAVAGMSSDMRMFAALGNQLIGDTEGRDYHLSQAEQDSQLAAKIAAPLATLEEFFDAPSFRGGLEQIASISGQLFPTVMQIAGMAVVSAGTGAIVGGIGKGVANHAARSAAKKILTDVVKKEVRGEALDQAEKVVLDSAFKYAVRMGKRGAVAGAFGGEYPLMAGASFREFQEAGIENTPLTALGAAFIGAAATAPSTAGEVLLLRAVGQIAKKKAKEEVLKTGTRGIFSQFARNLGAVTAKGMALEGTTEGIQEGVLVGQRLAIDPEYDLEEAYMRIGESFLVGMVGGGVFGAGLGAPSSAIGAIRSDAGANIRAKANEFLEKRREAKANAKMASSEYNINDGFFAGDTAPEAVADITAQIDAMANPNLPKEAVWIEQSSLEGRSFPNLPSTEELQNEPNTVHKFTLSGQEVYGAYIEGRGLILSKSRPDVETVVREQGSDKALQVVLGMVPQDRSEEEQTHVVSVFNPEGAVVQEETASASTLEQAQRRVAAYAEIPGWEVKVWSPQEALAARAERVARDARVRSATGLGEGRGAAPSSAGASNAWTKVFAEGPQTEYMYDEQGNIIRTEKGKKPLSGLDTGAGNTPIRTSGSSADTAGLNSEFDTSGETEGVAYRQFVPQSRFDEKGKVTDLYDYAFTKFKFAHKRRTSTDPEMVDKRETYNRLFDQVMNLLPEERRQAFSEMREFISESALKAMVEAHKPFAGMRVDFLLGRQSGPRSAPTQEGNVYADLDEAAADLGFPLTRDLSKTGLRVKVIQRAVDSEIGGNIAGVSEFNRRLDAQRRYNKTVEWDRETLDDTFVAEKVVEEEDTGEVITEDFLPFGNLRALTGAGQSLTQGNQSATGESGLPVGEPPNRVQQGLQGLMAGLATLIERGYTFKFPVGIRKELSEAGFAPDEFINVVFSKDALRAPRESAVYKFLQTQAYSAGNRTYTLAQLLESSAIESPLDPAARRAEAREQSAVERAADQILNTLDRKLIEDPLDANVLQEAFERDGVDGILALVLDELYYLYDQANWLTSSELYQNARILPLSKIQKLMEGDTKSQQLKKNLEAAKAKEQEARKQKELAATRGEKLAAQERIDQILERQKIISQKLTEQGQYLERKYFEGIPSPYGGLRPTSSLSLSRIATIMNRAHEVVKMRNPYLLEELFGIPAPASPIVPLVSRKGKIAAEKAAKQNETRTAQQRRDEEEFNKRFEWHTPKNTEGGLKSFPDIVQQAVKFVATEIATQVVKPGVGRDTGNFAGAEQMVPSGLDPEAQIELEQQQADKAQNKKKYANDGPANYDGNDRFGSTKSTGTSTVIHHDLGGASASVESNWSRVTIETQPSSPDLTQQSKYAKDREAANRKFLRRFTDKFVPELSGTNVAFYNVWNGAVKLMAVAASRTLGIVKPTMVYSLSQLRTELLTMKNDITSEEVAGLKAAKSEEEVSRMMNRIKAKVGKVDAAALDQLFWNRFYHFANVQVELTQKDGLSVSARNDQVEDLFGTTSAYEYAAREVANQIVSTGLNTSASPLSPYKHILNSVVGGMLHSRTKGEVMIHPDVNIIVINDMIEGFTPIQQAAVLAHEFGHVFFDQEISGLVDKKQKTVLYNRLVDAYKKAAKLHPVYNDPNVGFEEWYADQVGAFVLEELNPKSLRTTSKSISKRAHSDGIVGRYFKKLADKFLNFYNKAKELFGTRFSLAPSFATYMNDTLSSSKRHWKNSSRMGAREKIYVRQLIESVRSVIPDRVRQAFSGQVERIMRTGTMKTLSKYFSTSHTYLSKHFGEIGKELADLLYKDSGEVGARGWQQNTTYFYRQFSNKFFAIFDAKIEDDTDFLNSPEARAVLAIAEDDTLSNQAIEEQANAGSEPHIKALKVRKLFNDMYRQYIDPVLQEKIGFLNGFFTRMLDVQKISEKPDAFVDWLVANSSYNRSQANLLVYGNEAAGWAGLLNMGADSGLMVPDDAMLDEIPVVTEAQEVEWIRKNKPAIYKRIENRAAEDNTTIQEAWNRIREEQQIHIQPGLPSLLGRTLKDVSTKSMRSAIENDPDGWLVPPGLAVIQYMHSMTRRVEYERIGGTKRIVSLLRDIEEQQGAEARSEAEDVISAIMGKKGANVSRGWRTFNAWSTTHMVFTLLTFTSLSSMPDLTGIALRSKELGMVSNAIRDLRSLTWEEQKRFAADVGAATHEALDNMFISVGELDFTSPMAKKLTSGFFKWTGLRWWTRFTRVMAASVGRSFLLQLADGTLNERRTRYLEELNITQAEIRAWRDGGYNLNSEAGRAVSRAIAQFAEEAVIRPNAAERPTWASDPRMQFLFALKSYFFSWGKVVLGGAGREIKNRYREDGNFVGGAQLLLLGSMVMLPMAMLGMEIREWLRYMGRAVLPGVDADGTVFRTDRMNPIEYIFEMLERGGVFGPWSLAISTMDAVNFDGPLGVVSANVPSFDAAMDLVGKGNLNRTLPVVNNIYSGEGFWNIVPLDGK